jgi:hypothetical protein
MMSYLRDPTPFTPSSSAISTKTFIHDHLLTMDPCYHPRHSVQNGFLHYRRESPNRQTPPLFVLSKSTIHMEILGIPAEQLYLNVGEDPEWEGKEDERLFWRGSNTGLRFWFDECDPDEKKAEDQRVKWKESQRVRLVDLSRRKKGNASVLKPPSNPNETMEVVEVSHARLNPAFVDVAFSGKPIQCDVKMCDFLSREYDFGKKISQTDANRYKYFIDVSERICFLSFAILFTF